MITVVPTKFTAIDAMSPTMIGMSKNIAKVYHAAEVGIARQERLFRKLTPSLSGATKQLLQYAGAGALLGGAAYSGKAIMDYETAIQSLSAVTGVTGQQLEEFKKEIVDVADKTKKSAIDVAGSFEVIGSMMSQYLTDPKALRQISEAGITLSKASRQELVPSLEQLTSIMNQFNIGAEKADDTIQRLTAGEIVGSLRTAQVSEALQEFGAVAFSANVGLSESVALTEALAKQLKTDKIGVGARNILTIMDAATGLAKKARKELKHHGVDMGLLMDNSKTLSERLHELSKIQGDAKSMAKVFGKENLAAGNVIFNQLDTYDAFLAKIKTTNEAQHQAAINSDTLAQKVERLKNTWINYIATGDHAATGLAKLKDIVGYVTDNLDTFISVGIGALKFFALWKAAIIAQKVVLGALTVTMAIQKTVGAALYFHDMLKWYAVTNQVTYSTAALTLAQEYLSAAFLANPVGIIALGVTALAGAIYLATKRTEQLTEAYKKKMQLDSVSTVNKETDAVKKLVAEYWHLGMGIKDATINAIKFRMSTIDFQRQQTENRIKQTKSELEKEKANFGVGDVLAGTFGEEYKSGKEKDLASQLQAQQREANMLADRKLIELQFAQSQGLSNKDLGINSQSSKKSTGGGQPLYGNEPFRFGQEKPRTAQEKENDLIGKVIAAITIGFEKAKQNSTIDIKGLPAGTAATVTSNTIQTNNSF